MNIKKVMSMYWWYYGEYGSTMVYDRPRHKRVTMNHNEVVNILIMDRGYEYDELQ